MGVEWEVRVRAYAYCAVHTCVMRWMGGVVHPVCVLGDNGVLVLVRWCG